MAAPLLRRLASFLALPILVASLLVVANYTESLAKVFTFAILLVQDLPLVSYFSSVEESRIVTTLERDSFMLAGKSQDAFDSQNPQEVGSLQDVLDRFQLGSNGAHIVVTDIQAHHVMGPSLQQGLSEATRALSHIQAGPARGIQTTVTQSGHQFQPATRDVAGLRIVEQLHVGPMRYFFAVFLHP